MGCIIREVKGPDGKPSELFQELKQVMPEAEAMEYYLLLKGNETKYKEMLGQNKQGEVSASHLHDGRQVMFKLAGFQDYQEQVDTLNFLADEFVNTLKEFPDVESKSNISGLNLNAIARNPRVIDKAIKNLQTKILTHVGANFAALTDRQVELFQMAVNNLPSYLASDSSLGLLGRKLADRGIQIKITGKGLQDTVDATYEERANSDEEVDFEQVETQFNRIYDMEIIEGSVATSVLPSIKSYLQSKHKVDPSYVYKEGHPIEYQLSGLNSNRPMEHETVMGDLFRLLKNVQTVEEMETKLRTAAVNLPRIAPIVADLIAEKPVTIKVGKSSFAYRPIGAALFSAFAKNDYNMFTIVEDSKSGSVYFAPANKRSVENQVKARWSQDIADTLTPMTKTDKTAKIKSIDKFIANKQVTDQLDALKSPTAIVLGMAADLLNSVGYDVNGQDLFRLRDEVMLNPRFYDKDGKPRTFSAIMHSFLKTLGTYPLQGTDIFNASEVEIGEGKYLSALSNVVGERKSDVVLGAYLSSRGTMIHPLNTGSEAQDLFARYKTDEGFRNMLLEDPIYRNSPILKAMDGEDGKKFEVAVFDTLNDNAKANSGKTWSELSSFDVMASKLNGYINGAGSGALNNKYMATFSPTQSDRGNTNVLVVPKLNVDKKGNAEAMFDLKGNLKDGEFKDWITNQVSSELQRIVENKRFKGDKVKSYHDGNANRFNLFTDLNDPAIEGHLLANTGKNIDVLAGHAATQFKLAIDSDINYLIETGLIKKGKVGYEATANGKTVLGQNTKFTQVQMENFVANNFVYTYEQSLLYIGDPAYYTVNKESKPNAQKADMNKRFGLPFTPGVKMAVGQEFGMNPKANIVILKEPKVASEMREMYQELFGVDNYSNIELSDGAGFGSMSRFKSTLLARGMHSDDALSLIDSLENWKPGDVLEDVGATIEVAKPFYFRLQKGPHGRVMPFNLKYSLIPAIPSYMEAKVNGEYRFPGLAEISKKLRSGTADEVVMETAVKVGIHKAVDLKDLNKLSTQSIQIHNDSFRFPQPSPTKDKIMERLGSQVAKIAASNINPNTTFYMDNKPVKAGDALAEYNEALGSLVEKAGTEIYDRFLDGDELRTDQVIDQVLRDIESNNFNNIEYFQQALEVMEDKNTVLPLSFPSIKYKVDELVYAAFRNSVNKLKVPGHSAVQIPSMGTLFKKGDISVASDLKFVGLETLNGVKVEGEEALQAMRDLKAGKDLSKKYRTTPAEIRVSPRFFVGRLKEIASERVDRGAIAKMVKEQEAMVRKANPKMTDGNVARLMRNANQNMIAEEIELHFSKLKALIVDKKGNFDMTKIRDAGLDTVVTYRIPTQLKSSMLAARIVEFLPESAGSSIQVPAEIVAQSGSDFDIDKMYVINRSFDVDESNNFIKHGIGTSGEGTSHSTLDISSIKQGDEVYTSMGTKFTFVSNNGERGITLKAASGNNVNSPASTSLYALDISKNAVTSKNTRAKNKQEAQAYIHEFYSAVLTSPAHMMEVLAPNTKATLAKLVADKYKTGDGSITGSFFSLEVQELFRNNNRAGKELIAIASVASVNHSIAKQLGLEFVEKYSLNGVPFNLGEVQNVSKTAVISEEIGEIQTAALDNAKEPLLGQLNINSFTSSTVLLAIQLGHGLEYATSLVNSPAVKAMAAAYPKYERKNSRDAAMALTIAEVGKKYGLRAISQEGIPKVKLEEYSQSLADKALEAGSGIDYNAAQIKSMSVFLQLKDLGDILSTAQRSLNIDSRGTPHSSTGVITKYAAIANIENTRANLRERGLVEYSRNQSLEQVESSKFRNITHARQVFNEMSSEIRRTPDEKNYQFINKAKADKYGLLERVSSLVKDFEAPTDAAGKLRIENSQKAGTTIDVIGRQYFSGQKMSKPVGISAEAYKSMLEVFDGLDEFFKRTKQVPISDPGSLMVYDTLNKAGGEMDLVTIDDKGELRIYDMKTMVKEDASEYKSLEGKAYVDKRFIDHKNQLNGYRTIVANTTGVKAVQIAIIPIKLDYDEKGSITKVHARYFSGDDMSIVYHDIDNTVLATKEDVKNTSKILPAFQMKLDPPKIRVNMLKYAQHNMSDYEVNSIHKPLAVGIKLSPSASLQMQSVLKAVSDELGYLDDNQQTKVMAHYDSYLLQGKGSTSVAVSNLREFVASGESVALTSTKDNKSTGKLIKEYRKRMKQGEVTENVFIEKLKVFENEDRLYVTFDNHIAKALSGERKRELSNAFEDLMQTEPELAQSLTLYAITNYGFHQGINTFTNLLPPAAMTTYSKVSGKKGLSAVEFFRALDGTLNDKTNFAPDIKEFVDLYIRNNALRLPIQRVGSKADIVERMYDQDSDYILRMMPDGHHELFRRTPSGIQRLDLLGIPDLVMEYHGNEKSFYNNREVDMTKPEKKATKVQKQNAKVQLDLFKASTLMESVNNDMMGIKTVADATAFIDGFIKTKAVDLPIDTRNHLRAFFEGALKNAKMLNEKAKMDFALTFKAAMQETIEEFVMTDANVHQTLLKTIKSCN